MGLVPLSWQEIYAWVKCNGLEDTLTPFELNTIKTLSEEYVNEYSVSSDPRRPKPYVPVTEEVEIDREAVATQVENFFSQLKNKD